MEADAIEAMARGLLKGELAGAQPWEIGAAVQWLAETLARTPEAFSVQEMRKAGQTLNRHRRFEPTRLLGQAWLDHRGFDAILQRHWAQALIELSALEAAEALLLEGLSWLQSPEAGLWRAQELPEYEGLRARILKQRFVMTGDPEVLAQAAQAYLATYRHGPGQPWWHGINAVALSARWGDGLFDGLTPEALASTLHTRLLAQWQKDPRDAWLASTLSEACLALGRCDEAELWLYRFLHHAQVTPFHVDSYDRQLREIWGGDPLGSGPACASRLARLIAQHLLHSQARLSVSPGTLSTMARQLADHPAAFADLEKNFSGERSLGLDILRNMVDACASIGCVSHRRGERLGTGFLVPGNSLLAAWGPEPVFVTNAHVISTEVAQAIAPEDARVSFEVESAAADAPVFYAVAEVLCTSPPAALGTRCARQDCLDVTIVRLARLNAGPGTGLRGLDIAPRLPLVDPKSKAYVVGHPLGSGLQVSLHDSVLLDIDDDERLLHYRTPTDPGSSGSPVFNGAWKVIALHHGGSATTPRLRGSGEYQANEGIALSAIRHKLNT